MMNINECLRVISKYYYIEVIPSYAGVLYLVKLVLSSFQKCFSIEFMLLVGKL
jgi:hypothetical protein